MFFCNFCFFVYFFGGGFVDDVFGYGFCFGDWGGGVDLEGLEGGEGM